MGSRIGAGAAVAAVLLCAGLAGCSQNLIGTWCLPGPLRVSPATAAPVEVISVSSGPSDCNLGYRPGRTYRVTLERSHVAAPAVEVEPSRDGSFSISLVVPDGFPSGEAAVVVTGSSFDQCDDTGFGSCAGYMAPVRIR